MLVADMSKKKKKGTTGCFQNGDVLDEDKPQYQQATTLFQQN